MMKTCALLIVGLLAGCTAGAACYDDTTTTTATGQLTKDERRALKIQEHFHEGLKWAREHPLKSCQED